MNITDMEIQFVGEAGITQSCVNAVLRYLQFTDTFSKALILSCNHFHALILYTEDHEVIAVRSGFLSGYSGEGPKGLAYILSLLDEHETEIEEYEVKRKVMEKVNGSRLKIAELEKIENSRPVRPSRWRGDYVFVYKDKYLKKENRINRFPHTIPYSIIDPRIFDLATSFWKSSGDTILTGYKRLESVIRERCGLSEHGSKLFRKAFLGDKAVLGWPGLNSGEIVGRANLFIAAYSAFRNPRAHNEIKENSKNQLLEFLTLNHLFTLEYAARLLRQDKSPQHAEANNKNK